MLQRYYTRSDIHHHSRLDAYRKPQGAAETGSVVTLRLGLGENLKDSVCLLATEFEGEENLHEMRFCEKAGDRYLYESKIVLPDSPGLLHYTFTINDKSQLIHYGAPYGGGVGEVYEQKPMPYQITVHRPYNTPGWLKNSVMYHIFVDRFARGQGRGGLERGLDHLKKGRTLIAHEDWNEPPLYEPLQGAEFYEPCDFFGGDLNGVIGKLPYLAGLGVGCIYLSPVFESPSNHKYNTSDYKKIDEMFGTQEHFEELCEKCRALGIRVMLDGVFSHTGSDSVYFNKEGNYPGAGAYQSRQSAYYEWYRFKEWPQDYVSWWGFASLPEVDELNPSYLDFTLRDEDSVIKHWLKAGVSGFRLDVADELPDEYIRIMRGEAKKEDPDAALLGEIWEDASNKFSHGEQRQYVMGEELDSAMNYPFRDCLLRFLLGRMDAAAARHVLERQRENYPAQFLYACMNLLSSHDVPRALSLLSGAPDKDSGMSRKAQAEYTLSSGQLRLGRERLELATLLQFAFPGAPCIYYGDEAGVTGLMDPFNRGTYPWGREDAGLLEFFRGISAVRNGNAALRTGRCAYISPHSDVLGAVRFICGGSDVFGDPAQDGVFIVLANRADKPRSVFLDFSGLRGPDAALFRDYEGTYEDQLSGERVECGGVFYTKLEPTQGKLFKKIQP